MFEKNFIAVDIGKNMIKKVYKNTIEMFPATLYAHEQIHLENKPRKYDFEIEYQGEKFIGGTLGADEGIGAGFFNSDISKDHQETLINLLLALYLTGEKIFDVMVATPISQHLKEKNDSLKKLLKGNHTIKINGEYYTFYIRNVDVGPEGASAYFAYPKKGIVHGLDFGSTTVNYFTIDGNTKRFINKSSGTFNYGAKSYEGLNVSMKAKEVIANLKNKWNKDDYVMVLGGWGEEAYPVIKEYFTSAELVNRPLTATVEGLYELGMMKREKTIHS